jgi:hypothetical protein
VARRAGLEAIMLRVLLVLTILAASPAVQATSPLDDLRASFGIGGKPIPPNVFGDIGDAMMSDSRAVIVGIDALAAIDSNRYADPIKRDGAWIAQIKPQTTGVNGAETESYRFIGAATNGLLVVLTSWSGGGTGIFYTLHIVDAAWANAFDEDGAPYRRLVLMPVRSIILGDRWQGEVTIAGNAVRIATTASRADRSLSPQVIEAKRP